MSCYLYAHTAINFRESSHTVFRMLQDDTDTYCLTSPSVFHYRRSIGMSACIPICQHTAHIFAMSFVVHKHMQLSTSVSRHTPGSACCKTRSTQTTPPWAARSHGFAACSSGSSTSHLAQKIQTTLSRSLQRGLTTHRAEGAP